MTHTTRICCGTAVLWAAKQGPAARMGRAGGALPEWRSPRLGERNGGIMSEQVGRAGFHAKHTKAVGERAAILHEAMRELDPQSVAYWAARNPNIVVADEQLNIAMVNDDSGGFARCTDRRQVLDYGESRVGLLSRKLREDAPDKNGKMTGGAVTTSLLVSHLPKSMCEEIEDFYPVLDATTGEPVVDKNTGEPMRRSRWVAADRDEAIRYFEDVVDYLAENVIPGGRDAVLGYDIQFSESTPHIQIIAATFGTSRSFRSRQAAPMQKRWAPPALASIAAAITVVASISLPAFTPVSKCWLWLQ